MVRPVRWLISNVINGATTGESRSPTEPTTSNTDRDYNYQQFRFWPAREGIQRSVTAGEEATDTTVYTLNGDAVQLSTLWHDRPLVIEFGSITCPIFAAKVNAMDELARRYDGAVDFYVVYTREAHPGQRYHRHTSFEQKCQHARDAKQYESIERVVLVDDIEGTMHRTYDSLPNSVYVIGTDGIVAHRADWLDVDRLDAELQHLLDHGGRGADVPPTTLEENYHKPDADLFRTMLRVNGRAGAGSLRDMLVAGPRMMAHRLGRNVADRLRT